MGAAVGGGISRTIGKSGDVVEPPLNNSVTEAFSAFVRRRLVKLPLVIEVVKVCLMYWNNSLEFP